jgi:methylenetetrahydrofolate reductase (NADPH)
LRRTFGLDIAPHIAISRFPRSKLREQLNAYKSAGIRRIVAIRGDAPHDHVESFSGDAYPNTVDFVAELKNEFALEPMVAAYPDVHPRALSPQQDLDHLKRKVDAGATLAISQFFFLADTFLRFREKLHAAQINVPLAAGIMPIGNLAQIVKFAGGCGTIVPDGFAKRFDRHGNDQLALFAEGVAHAVELCDHLRREGVEHFHFYTLNRSEMAQAICDKLG